MALLNRRQFIQSVALAAPAAANAQVVLSGPIMKTIAAAGGGASASSTFTSDENPLRESGLWEQVPTALGDMNKASGTARCLSTSTICNLRIASPSFAANQYSQVTTVFAGGFGCGPSVRTTTDSFYCWFPGDGYVYRVTGSGSGFDTVGAAMSGVASGSVVKITISGTTIEVFDDGASKGTRTDGTIASGQPGIFGYVDNVSANTLDNFSAADL